VVLVVDDDPHMLELMEAMLGSFEYAVVSASKPAEGLALALQQPFDCAVVDVEMPGGGGAALARALNRGVPDLPVIMMSGLSYDEIVERIGGVMTTSVLCKPFRLRDLRQAISDALQWAASGGFARERFKAFGSLE
jgi:CheY-like chemotaxis protein